MLIISRYINIPFCGTNCEIARFQAELKFPNWPECGNNWLSHTHMVAYSHGCIITNLETCILLIFHTYFLAYMQKGIHKHPNICIYFYPLIHEYFHTCRVHTSVSVNLYTCTIAYTHHKYLYYCLIAYMHTFILAYLHVLIIVYSFVGMLT